MDAINTATAGLIQAQHTFDGVIESIAVSAGSIAASNVLGATEAKTEFKAGVDVVGVAQQMTQALLDIRV